MKRASSPQTLADISVHRLEPEVVSVNQAARLLALGRTSVNALAASGTLPTLRIGTRRLVRLATIRALVAGLERAGGTATGWAA